MSLVAKLPALPAWKKLGLLGRLLTMVGMTVSLAAASVFYIMTQHDARQAQAHLQDELQEITSLLLPTLSQNTLHRDYRTVHLLLNTQIANRPHLKQLSWTFANGISLVTVSSNHFPKTPAWFKRVTGLRQLERVTRIPLDNNSGGELQVVLSPAYSLSNLYRHLGHLIRSLIIVTALVFISITLMLRGNIQIIREITRISRSFGQGDFSLRTKPHGARELRAAAIAFNNMADQTEYLLEKLSLSKKQLANQLHFISQLLDTLPVPVYYLDEKGRFLNANHAWYQLTGKTKKECVRQASTGLYAPTNQGFAELQKNKQEELLQQHRLQTYETTFIDQHGKRLDVLISQALFIDKNGRDAGIIGSITDLTEQKRALNDAQAASLEKDSAQKANEAKSLFLASMSHEMRNPLTAIIGYSEMLMNTNKPARNPQQKIEIIHTAGKHLLQLINDLLDLSKIEAGKLTLEREPVNLRELAQEVSYFATPQVESKNIFFRLHQDPALPEHITTDPLRLKQILINLCSNAIKFTEQGGVDLELKNDTANQQVIFSIRDTGIGISAEQREKLFRAFSQADLTTSKKFGGTGLGLFLSKKLTEMLGGTLQLESEQGKGSCFTISLVNTETMHSATGETDDLATSASPLCGRVLLAEDFGPNQQLVAAILEDHDVKLDIVENGLEVLKKTEQQAYDLIILDIQMPVMDGIQAARSLRGKGDQTPIIALSANVMPDNRMQCELAGMNDFINKPIVPEQFVATLQPYLGKAANPIPRVARRA